MILGILSAVALVLVVAVALDRGRARRLSDRGARALLSIAALLVVLGALLR
jgi:hypothetical protein